MDAGAGSENLPLVLASASPRRREILESYGLRPVVIPAGVEECLPAGSLFTPEETTMYLAELKATAVFKSLDPAAWPRGCSILGVDTIVYKGRVIEKPKDEMDALDILRSLENASHDVISGVCIIRAVPLRGRLAAAEKFVFYDSTTVRFGIYSDEDILAYIRANPPYDKSGSYAIQSEWGRHVLEIDGDIENVIGLPYKKLSAYL